MSSSGPYLLNSVSAWLFLGGLVLISVAYLSATYGGKIMSAENRKHFQTTLTIGVVCMYISLLLMPAVPLWYYHQQKTINRWDWISAAAQWSAYGLLPLGLQWWKMPKHATKGAAVLIMSLLCLLGSGVAGMKAQKQRNQTASKFLGQIHFK